MKQKLYTSINEFKQSLQINEGKVSSKDWKRMVDLYRGTGSAEKVANSIKDKEKVINRYVAGLKLANAEPKLSKYSDNKFERAIEEFDAFGNKALELGATFDEIKQKFDNTEIPEEFKQQVSTDAIKGKKFDNRFVGDISRAIIKNGGDINFIKSGNALTHDGRDAMSRNGIKWTIGYEAEITMNGKKYDLIFDAITDEGDGPTYYVTSTRSDIEIDSYEPVGIRKFIRTILNSIKQETVVESVLNNKEKIINLEFEDQTDLQERRYSFSFETVDAQGAPVLDYSGTIDLSYYERNPDEIDWTSDAPEDYETAEEYILDEFYTWFNNKKKNE